MTNHPYKNQSERAFWSQSVSKNFIATDLLDSEKKLLQKGDIVTSAGSCFASNLIPYIEQAGLTYIRTETIPDVFTSMGENLGYSNFSAAYGNIYTARQLLQLYKRSIDEFAPLDSYFQNGNQFIDLLRPGLRFPAASKDELDYRTKIHLSKTREAFESADVFVFTLGLTEGWISKLDGTTYPACPGTIAGEFDSGKYEFHNFSVSEIIEDTTNFIEKLRNNNPKLRFIITVSPVPLVATATANHVLSATIYSKSVLRVAAEEICKVFPNVFYFPAFEIITGPQAPQNFFENDRRNVSALGVAEVMNTLLAASGLGASKIKTATTPKNDDAFSLSDLSRKIAVADCDEIMLDENI